MAKDYDQLTKDISAYMAEMRKMLTLQDGGALAACVRPQ